MAGRPAAPARAPLPQRAPSGRPRESAGKQGGEGRVARTLRKPTSRTDLPRCSCASPVGHARPTLAGVTKGAGLTARHMANANQNSQRWGCSQQAESGDRVQKRDRWEPKRSQIGSRRVGSQVE